MRKIITLLIVVVTTGKAFAQEDTLRYLKYPSTYGPAYPRIWASKILRTPFSDTSALNALPGAIQAGLDGRPYWWDGIKWNGFSTPADLSGYMKFTDSLLKYVTPGQLKDSLTTASLDRVLKNGNHSTLGLVAGGFYDSAGTFKVDSSKFQYNGSGAVTIGGQTVNITGYDIHLNANDAVTASEIRAGGISTPVLTNDNIGGFTQVNLNNQYNNQAIHQSIDLNYKTGHDTVAYLSNFRDSNNLSLDKVLANGNISGLSGTVGGLNILNNSGPKLRLGGNYYCDFIVDPTTGNLAIIPASTAVGIAGQLNANYVSVNGGSTYRAYLGVPASNVNVASMRIDPSLYTPAFDPQNGDIYNDGTHLYMRFNGHFAQVDDRNPYDYSTSSKAYLINSFDSTNTYNGFEGGVIRVRDSMLFRGFVYNDSMHHSLYSRILTQVSYNNGKTWSDTACAYTTPNGYGNVVVGFIEGTARIALLFKNQTTLVTYRGYSNDTGHTWQTPVALTTDSTITFGAFTKAHGKYLVNLHKPYHTYVLQTTDGINYSYLSDIDSTLSRKVDEVGLAYLGGDSLVAIVRDDDRLASSLYYQYTSVDNGTTWQYKGRTNMGYSFSAAPLVLWDSVKQNLICFNTSRWVTTNIDAVSQLSENKNKMYVYANTPATVWNNPNVWTQIADIPRPYVNGLSMYGYPAGVRLTNGDWYIMLTDAAPLATATSLNSTYQKDQMYQFYLSSNGALYPNYPVNDGYLFYNHITGKYQTRNIYQGFSYNPYAKRIENLNRGQVYITADNGTQANVYPLVVAGNTNTPVYYVSAAGTTGSKTDSSGNVITGSGKVSGIWQVGDSTLSGLAIYYLERNVGGIGYHNLFAVNGTFGGWTLGTTGAGASAFLHQPASDGGRLYSSTSSGLKTWEFPRFTVAGEADKNLYYWDNTNKLFVAIARPAGDGMFLTTNSGNYTWVNNTGATTVASYDSSGQTGTITTAARYAAASNTTVQIGCYLNVTAISSGTVTLTATYTDVNGNGHTLTFSPAITTVSTSGYAPQVVRVKAGTNVDLKATFSGTSVTYNSGGYIMKMY